MDIRHGEQMSDPPADRQSAANRSTALTSWGAASRPGGGAASGPGAVASGLAVAASGSPGPVAASGWVSGSMMGAVWPHATAMTASKRVGRLYEDMVKFSGERGRQWSVAEPSHAAMRRA